MPDDLLDRRADYPVLCIRVSPHFYNTADEVLGVLEEMSAVLSGR